MGQFMGLSWQANPPVPGLEHELLTLKKSSKNQYHYAVRRAQNSLKKIENDKLLSKLSSAEIFDEIKKSCKDKNSDLTSVIDDVHGAQNISNHFKNIYQELYNEQAGLNQNLIHGIAQDFADNPSEASETIRLVNIDLVKAAVKKMKTDKSDVTEDFTSDCLKNAPDIFYEQLAALFAKHLKKC